MLRLIERSIKDCIQLLILHQRRNLPVRCHVDKRGDSLPIFSSSGNRSHSGVPGRWLPCCTSHPSKPPRFHSFMRNGRWLHTHHPVDLCLCCSSCHVSKLVGLANPCRTAHTQPQFSSQKFYHFPNHNRHNACYRREKHQLIHACDLYCFACLRGSCTALKIEPLPNKASQSSSPQAEPQLPMEALQISTALARYTTSSLNGSLFKGQHAELRHQCALPLATAPAHAVQGRLTLRCLVRQLPGPRWIIATEAVLSTQSFRGTYAPENSSSSAATFSIKRAASVA